MNRRVLLLAAAIVSLFAVVALLSAQSDQSRKVFPYSGVYDSLSPDFELGLGNVADFNCTTQVATQPASYAGNFLLSCGPEVPHNETSIAVDPANPNHIVGAFHTYMLSTAGASGHVRVVATPSVSVDGGQSWRLTAPPVAPYQFTVDPAVAFTKSGRIYLTTVAANNDVLNDSAQSAPDIVVQQSDDGGITWTNPSVVAAGKGSPIGNGRVTVQDKQFIAVDTSNGPYSNRAYVAWTSIERLREGQPAFGRLPILLSFSADGLKWSPTKEISGFSPDCNVALFGQPNECDINLVAVPTVAPTSRIYVGFENFNTPAENQYLVVSSTDGGVTFGNPARVGSIFDVNLPLNVQGRQTLTGCQMRVISPGNVAADPSDTTGRTVYATWADNRAGSAAATNLNVVLARSIDGGINWQLHLLDTAPNDQFYPWVAVAPNGRVDVGYMDRSLANPGNPGDQTECKYGFSLTRTTFNANGTMNAPVKQTVSSALSDAGRARWFSSTTGGRTRFLGDYNGIAIGSNGATWSLWTDHRNIVANPPSVNFSHGQHAVAAVTP